MQTRPSKRWPRATSSIESAITSRETSEARIPSVPIVTPSEIEIVLNSSGVPPASRIPRLMSRASARWFQLHGIVSIHVVATPTCGRARSSSVRPIPFSIARAGARSTPSVSAALCRFAGSLGRAYGSPLLDDIQLRDLALVERPQARPDLLDVRLRQLAPVLVEARLAALHLGDPLAGERPVADAAEGVPHRVLHLRPDHLRPDGVRAVLRRVGDRVVHALEPTFPDQVDDELQLVHALPVRHLGLVAGLDERVEAVPDQLRDAAAEDRLLAEEVGLGLLDEARLDHPRTGGADRGAVGERDVERAAARVLRDGDDRGRAEALRVEPADDVTRPLR